MGWNTIRGEDTKPVSENGVKVAWRASCRGSRKASGLPTTHQPRPRLYGRELGQKVDVPKRKITLAELC